MGHISDKYIYLSEARDTIYRFLKRVGIITFFFVPWASFGWCSFSQNNGKKWFKKILVQIKKWVKQKKKKDFLKYNESLLPRENNGQGQALFSHWNSILFVPTIKGKKAKQCKEEKKETRNKKVEKIWAYIRKYL